MTVSDETLAEGAYQATLARWLGVPVDQLPGDGGFNSDDVIRQTGLVGVSPETGRRLRAIAAAELDRWRERGAPDAVDGVTITDLFEASAREARALADWLRHQAYGVISSVAPERWETELSATQREGVTRLFVWADQLAKLSGELDAEARSLRG